MNKIQVENLTEGMVLGADVQNTKGQTLISVGTTLSKKQIGLLQKQNVAQVSIADKEQKEKSTKADATAEGEDKAGGADDNAAAIAKVDDVFSAVKDDKLMMELYALAMTRAERGNIHV